MPFGLPDTAGTFVEAVVERAHTLIHSGIWRGFDPTRLDAWTRSFGDDLEQYFGACILDSLIFRSEEQTSAMMDQLFQRAIPDTVRLFPPASGPEGDWLTLLRSSKDPGIRVVPVIRVDEPPTKSGPVLARMCRRFLQINERWILWPWHVEGHRKRGVRAFLFVDDFLGSGRQFVKFYKRFGFRQTLRDSYQIYAPLAAHHDGTEQVRGKVPGVLVTSAERLRSSASLFHQSSLAFDDGVNTPAGAREFYLDFIRRRNLKVPSDFREGYGSQALTYVFSHGTPNNCLPLLWHSSAAWRPPFER